LIYFFIMKSLKQITPSWDRYSSGFRAWQAAGRVFSAQIFLLFVFLGLLSACGGGGSNATDQATQNATIISETTSATSSSNEDISIGISPISANLSKGQQLTFTADVSGGSNKEVTWSVQEGDAGGSITQGGEYSAPGIEGTFHIVATSKADESKTAIATVHVTSGASETHSENDEISILINPASISLATGRSQTFTATVSGTGNTAVTWSIQEGVTGGAISPEGLYTAPSEKGSYHIIATSQQNSSKSAIASVLVLPGGITRVSVSSSGEQGDLETSHPICTSWFSADGRYVAFASHASNLIDDDTNDQEDAFLHDRLTGITTRLTVGTDGLQAENGNSNSPSFSNDVRYVVFTTYANNLDPRDTNHYRDMYVLDRQTHVTSLISYGYDGSAGNLVSGGSPQMSGNGRYVVFNSSASNLVPNDTNASRDTFFHDLATHTTTRVDVGYDGSEANGESSSGSPAISNNGRFIAFYSDSSNLVSGDTNDTRDLFVWDRETGVITRESVDSEENEGNNGTGGGVDIRNPRSNLPSIPKDVPAINPDGRFVAFYSDAGNLVPGDTNELRDIFVRDRVTGQTMLASIGLNGEPANGASDGNPWFSADGRYLGFQSFASNLVEGDTNGHSDIFVRDLWTGITKRISIAYDGNEGNNDSLAPTISADGRWITFASDANNLVPGDTNEIPGIKKGRDVFVVPMPEW
jgi:hypothetical protein